MSKVYDGEGSGNLAQYFTFEKLLEGDADEDGVPVESVLTMETKQTETTQPWQVQVWVNGSNLTGPKNYTVEYDQVFYTILPADGFLLNRAATEEGKTVADVCEKYDGKKVEVKMAARPFVANRWYSMVLPFDIKTSEFSKALGYAVVDVPNESNTDEGVVAFKLHVGNIPANTLFVFKVEEDPSKVKDLVDEDGNFSFGTREINYVEEAVTKDAAENEYRGVYTTTEISEDGYWYLSEGKFYNAGAFSNANNGQAVIVSPLSGYVFAPIAGANARILVEEPDGTTTAINAVTGEAVNNNAEGWYSIDGMKLNAQPTQKGVYINNGKKVVIK